MSIVGLIRDSSQVTNRKQYDNQVKYFASTVLFWCGKRNGSDQRD